MRRNFSNAALLQTLEQYGGVGSDADLSDDVRFLVGVTSLIQKRIHNGELKETHSLPAVFFLHPAAPSVATSPAAKKFPMLDNGLARISGRIWFVNKVANDGTAIDLQGLDDEALFRLVIDDLCIGDRPAIIFEPRTSVPEVRYYPEGLAHTDSCRIVEVDLSALTMADVFAVIDRLHEQYLCTPDVQGRAGKLWKDSRRHWAAEDAEDAIQIVIRNGLTGAFPTCIVRAEQPQATGRLDVEIEEPIPGRRSMVIRHAVIELKVLRARRSSGASVPDSENLEWVRKGVIQAAEYRDERNARNAGLCCFDMRIKYNGGACFDHVDDLADRLEVFRKSWHLFGSSEEYRNHRIALTMRESNGDLGEGAS